MLALVYIPTKCDGVSCYWSEVCPQPYSPRTYVCCALLAFPVSHYAQQGVNCSDEFR
jgi:hypothetical protein